MFLDMLASACALQRPLPSHSSVLGQTGRRSLKAPLDSKHMGGEVGFEREKWRAWFLEQKPLVSPAKDFGVGFGQ